VGCSRCNRADPVPPVRSLQPASNRLGARVHTAHCQPALFAHEAILPCPPPFAAVLVALICGSVMAQNAAAVLQAGPKLLAAIFTLHAGEIYVRGTPRTSPKRLTSSLSSSIACIACFLESQGPLPQSPGGCASDQQLWPCAKRKLNWCCEPWPTPGVASLTATHAPAPELLSRTLLK
jgi:hypothetical protein